jgi:SAM-dependent methyltransferase
MAVAFQAPINGNPQSLAAIGRIELRCPACLANMPTLHAVRPAAEAVCSACGFMFLSSKGIWRALAPGRADYFRRFIRDYETVRSQEGRGSARSDFYLALPYQDLTGRNSWQWKIRGRSFRYLESEFLPHIEAQYPDGLDVLDIGAGNGWMSYRLALRGHHPVAVDLLVNEEDGLGAARHFNCCLPEAFLCFQAEMDRLPFAASQFDLVVFNASFHYSEDYQRTLRECLRCLRRGGHLLIIDSPFYAHDESGQQMVEERRREFQMKYGFSSDGLRSGEYLTPERLKHLGRACGLDWTLLKPWYGFGWAIRPFKARMLRRREPAKFFIFCAAVAGA